MGCEGDQGRGEGEQKGWSGRERELKRRRRSGWWIEVFRRRDERRARTGLKRREEKRRGRGREGKT